MMDIEQTARAYLRDNPNATFQSARRHAEIVFPEKKQVVAFARAVAHLRCDERRLSLDAARIFS